MTCHHMQNVFLAANLSGWAADEARLVALAAALGQRQPGDAPGAFEIDTSLLYRCEGLCAHCFDLLQCNCP